MGSEQEIPRNKMRDSKHTHSNCLSKMLVATSYKSSAITLYAHLWLMLPNLTPRPDISKYRVFTIAI